MTERKVVAVPCLRHLGREEKLSSPGYTGVKVTGRLVGDGKGGDMELLMRRQLLQTTQKPGTV